VLILEKFNVLIASKTFADRNLLCRAHHACRTYILRSHDIHRYCEPLAASLERVLQWQRSARSEGNIYQQNMYGIVHLPKAFFGICERAAQSLAVLLTAVMFIIVASHITRDGNSDLGTRRRGEN
jgi:hypothetical protein